MFQRAPQATEIRFARVKVPSSLPPWVALPVGADNGQAGQAFVRLLDIIAHSLDELFPGMEILEIMPFRLTRNADIELDDEPGDDLVELVAEGLRQRRLEDPVRLEHGRRIFREIAKAMRATDIHEATGIVSAGHVMGTYRMGTDPKQSVVSPEHRSHDHPNLFLLGSGVFPTGAAPNPTLTIAALTLRAVAAIQASARP